jgi:ATP-dependent helicase/nuclease subunit B
LEHRTSSIDKPVQSIEWVSLKPDKKDKEIVLAIDVTTELKNNLEQQIRDDLQSVWDGSPMFASGPNHVCQYCDVRGVCRKGMWINE